jgi:hypothetical protein
VELRYNDTAPQHSEGALQNLYIVEGLCSHLGKGLAYFFDCLPFLPPSCKQNSALTAGKKLNKKNLAYVEKI